MTRPAMPESETPETDAKWHQCAEELPFTLAASDPIGGLGEIVPAEFARSLERRLAQAQTELVRYQTTHTALMKEADRKYDEAQTRIAELEKVIYESRMPHGLCKLAGSCTACTAQQALDGIAIDSALKSRP